MHGTLAIAKPEESLTLPTRLKGLYFMSGNRESERQSVIGFSAKLGIPTSPGYPRCRSSLMRHLELLLTKSNYPSKY